MDALRTALVFILTPCVFTPSFQGHDVTHGRNGGPVAAQQTHGGPATPGLGHCVASGAVGRRVRGAKDARWTGLSASDGPLDAYVQRVAHVSRCAVTAQLQKRLSVITAPQASFLLVCYCPSTMSPVWLFVATTYILLLQYIVVPSFDRASAPPGHVEHAGATPHKYIGAERAAPVARPGCASRFEDLHE